MMATLVNVHIPSPSSRLRHIRTHKTSFGSCATNLQLAKLIVNSGGAAALVDYVADAQASEGRSSQWVVVFCFECIHTLLTAVPT